jgi:hypothetical protein
MQQAKRQKTNPQKGTAKGFNKNDDFKIATVKVEMRHQVDLIPKR